MKTPPMMGGHSPFGEANGFSNGHGGEHRPHRERSLEEIMKTVWLTPENAAFARRDGLLWLTLEGKETRVSLRRDFPFEQLWAYISVLGPEEEEIGMIRSLDLFEGETASLLREELERRYYSPVILRIHSLKERYGFSYWKVETAEGEMEFTLHDTYKSLIHIDDKRVIILDVDGNRFEIPDVSALDRRSYRKIELYL
ncbi:MAG: DUF1854 domain-containing protein [Clostridia bacterium]|nr:DUF1854 domain-containing protein [Clostridia bacterium]